MANAVRPEEKVLAARRCFISAGCRRAEKNLRLLVLYIAAGVALMIVPGCRCGGGVRESRSVEAVFAPPIGVCTSVKNHEVLRKAGCSYIEESVQRFLVPTENEERFLQNYRESEKSGLPVYACNGFLPGRLKSVGPDAAHHEILAYAETAFRRANKAGVRIIVFGSGGSRGIPEGFDAEQAEEQFVKLLKKMGPIARKYNVIVVIEPLNRAECNFINTVAEGADVVRRVGHPNIKLLADFYHMSREGERPEAMMDAGGLLEHCHIAEKERRTPPGVAGDDFTGYFRALKEINYTGRISVECRWDNLAQQLPRAVANLRQQYEEVN